MIAAGHTGVNASSRLHRGRGHYLNPRKNHLAKLALTIAMTRWHRLKLSWRRLRQSLKGK